MGRTASFDDLKRRGQKYLEQYGTKGMKWGVRRSKEQLDSSPDAVKVVTAQAKIKQGGTRTLSNQELQSVVTRMNLEQQYGRLSQAQMSKGRKFAVALFGDVAKRQVTTLANQEADRIRREKFPENR